MYLENLFIDRNSIEDRLYAIYLPMMKNAGASSRPFTNFSHQNHETLQRFKWRWLNSLQSHASKTLE